MSNINKKQLVLVAVFVVIIVAIGIGGYYYGHRLGYEEGEEIGRATSQVEVGDVVSNPMENMPSTNPFEKVVNPFEEAYQNPFE